MGRFVGVSSSPAKKIDPVLSGVSETALLTLAVRASEARRTDGIILDPMAIAMVDAIEYDFAKFGHVKRQDMAVRALAFDRETRRFLVDHPAATVVALAEGFQTSFHRLDSAGVGHRFRWLSVDLPPMIEIRAQLLPPNERVAALEQSALDYSWMDHVDDGDGVFITAEGLLMYLQPEDALGLIAECARRFPGGRMMFDLPPAWFAKLISRGIPTSSRYRIPRMPFSMSPSEAADLVNTVPGVRMVHDIPLPEGRGRVWNTVTWAVQRLPIFDPVRPTMTLLEFG